MLGLQTEAPALLVDDSGFSGNRTVEEISGIELQARFGRRYIEHAARRRFEDASRMNEPVVRAVQDKVVVVSFSELQLFVFKSDSSADLHGPQEIERRYGDRREHASGNQSRIDGSVAIRIDGEFVIEHIAFSA